MTMRPSIRRILCTSVTFMLAASVAAQATTSSRIVYERGGEIWKMKDDGTQETQLTDPEDADLRPNICPSGRIIVFERTTGFDLYRIDQDGGSEENLTNSGDYEGDPDCGLYGSNTTYIVYVSDEDGSDGDIYRMDVHGNNPVQLTHNDYEEAQPTWCGSHQVAFARRDNSEEDGYDWEIWIMDVSNGGNAVKLTDNQVDDQEPACHPSGSFVAFQRDPVVPLTEVDVWVLEVDNPVETQINYTTHEDIDFDAIHPTYSPGGTYLAFAGDATGGNFNIYKMEAEPESEAEPLTNDTEDIYEVQPNWSELVP